MSNVDPTLIFDIGMHKGGDTEFYLDKGFRVMGLEASPDLCAFVRQRRAADIASGKLSIVEKALYDHEDQEVTFYINPEKDDWGSLEKNNAEKGVGASTAITVKTTTLDSLLRQFGLPYYIKCDIEGGDAIFVQQLVSIVDKPTFVSIEATQAADLAKLLVCGYDAFQLVNQYLNPFTPCPSPPREGVYVNKHFSHVTSGLFGKELPAHQWISFEQTMHMFLDWYALRSRNEGLAIGWLDVHACRRVTLSAPG